MVRKRHQPVFDPESKRTGSRNRPRIRRCRRRPAYRLRFVWRPTLADRNRQQYDGEPAVDEDGIYVPLEDGAVTALGLSPSQDSERRETNQDPDHSRWTTDRTGPPLTLTAGDGLVVGRHEDGVLVLEIENGDELLEHTEPVFDVAAGGGFAWASIEDEEPTLTGYDSDGNRIASLELPWRPNWLTTAGSTALVGSRGDGVWAVDADAGDAESEETEPRWTLEADLDSQDPVVFDETLSILAGGNLIAIDIESGDQRWELEGYSISGPLLADGDGIYSRGTPPGETACGLFAVTASGEEWWSVPPHDDLGCSGDLHLVGDRLVVVDGRDLYGFRNDPGSRFSIL